MAVLHGTIVRDTQCWRRPRKNINVSSALMRSQERSYRGRKLELKYLRDLGVHENVDERDVIARHRISSVVTETRESPCKSGHVERGI